MYWNRVKTLLLAVLIAANAFLAFRLYRLYREKDYISEEYASQASQVLEAAGINIKSENIPLKKPTVPIVTLEGFDDEMKNFALKLAGGEQTEVIEEADKIVYSGADMTLMYDKNGYFEYTAQRDVSKERVSARKAKSLVKTFLELSELPDSDFKIIQSEKNENGYTFSVLRKINSVEVSGYSAQIEIIGGSVASAAGKLFAGKTVRSMATDFSDSVNVLFTLSKTSDKMDIDSMKLVYTESSDGKDKIFTPMYEIIASDREFKYDLSTGQIIN